MTTHLKPHAGVTFSTIAGRQLEYLLINAEREGRPWIVFLHEGLGSLSLWRDFPQALCDACDARGLVYSRYGYGRSEPLPADARPRQRGVDFMHREAIDVLPELLSRLSIEHPILFGHSDGGSISLIYGATFPESAAGLVVLAPHVMVEDLSIKSIEASKTTYETTDLPAKLARHHADPDSAFWGWNDIWLNPEFRDWNIENLLPLIECPVLAIQGEDDEYGTMAQIDAIGRDVAGARLLKLARCGHSPHKDQPQAVIAATGAFIASLSEVK